MSAVDWSELPRDALGLISDRLAFGPDHLCFRSVCTSWRFSTPNRLHLPWLIGHRKDADGNYTIFSFFTVSPENNGKLTRIAQFPEESAVAPAGMPCRGSSHGWMALLDPTAPSIVLWNPLTRSKIQLPTLPYFPNFDGCRYSKISSGEYTQTYMNSKGEEIVDKLSSKEMEYRFPNQVVLSADPAVTSDYIAAAFCAHHRKLVFFRSGDNAWTVMNIPEFRRWTKGAVFYKGRFFFTAYQSLYACIFGEDMRVQGIELVSRIRCCDDEMHLVQSGDDLLLVAKQSAGEPPRKMHWFQVFKLQWGDQQKVKLVKLDGLGNRALFLGRSHSLSLPASRFPGCRANCVYYHETNYADENREGNYFAMCDVGDHTSRATVCLPHNVDRPHPDWKPCAWFTPSLMPGRN